MQQRQEYLDSLLEKSDKSLDGAARSLIVRAADNLGQVERYAAMDVEELSDFCNLVVDKIAVVTGVNAFKIGQRIKIKEDGDGYEPDLFFQMLNHVLMSRIMESDGYSYSRVYAEMIRICSKYAQELTLVGVKKDATLDMWILEMRKVEGGNK